MEELSRRSARLQPHCSNVQRQETTRRATVLLETQGRGFVIMCLHFPMGHCGWQLALARDLYWRKTMRMSIRFARNPAKLTKSHQAM
jgi:hypothetical protein